MARMHPKLSDIFFGEGEFHRKIGFRKSGIFNLGVDWADQVALAYKKKRGPIFLAVGVRIYYPQKLGSDPKVVPRELNGLVFSLRLAPETSPSRIDPWVNALKPVTSCCID